MNDDNSLPPTRDLPPGRLNQRAEHLRSEITRPRERHLLSSLGSQILGAHPRVYAVGAVCVLLAVALSLALIPKSHNAPHTTGADGPLMVTLTPDTQVVGGVAHVWAQLQFASDSGTGTITVFRFKGGPGSEPYNETLQAADQASKVVYEEQVAMTEVSAGNVSSGEAPIWSWRGSLSTSDWAGGCEAGYFYAIRALIGDPNSYSSAGQTRWFTCQSDTNAAGPTGITGATDGG